MQSIIKHSWEENVKMTLRQKVTISNSNSKYPAEKNAPTCTQQHWNRKKRKENNINCNNRELIKEMVCIPSMKYYGTIKKEWSKTCNSQKDVWDILVILWSHRTLCIFQFYKKTYNYKKCWQTIINMPMHIHKREIHLNFHIYAYIQIHASVQIWKSKRPHKKQSPASGGRSSWGRTFPLDTSEF